MIVDEVIEHAQKVKAECERRAKLPHYALVRPYAVWLYVVAGRAPTQQRHHPDGGSMARRYTITERDEFMFPELVGRSEVYLLQNIRTSALSEMDEQAWNAYLRESRHFQCSCGDIAVLSNSGATHQSRVGDDYACKKGHLQWHARQEP